ncbi:MAG: hypothetical protein KUF77_15430 [Candidatus Thiodiazotropha sp. (ex Lucina aurantia)]|nr:hypothetical protein [Candidatus Thiodiazotropha sp. (ex Lucina pensylvanica)]MBV2099519.1 hypothetical protein [Candidatus Thiodiazotropha sp. (ex Codakia orbicularis)]MBV2104416.1 hypothetical protein [Candidatus Thiodiazotropha sp. (ex Lucina aurantia)]MBV2118802.1 hypothetical protein [Candidatus Thiodiazotropha sp. (ex Lucina aurantia)]
MEPKALSQILIRVLSVYVLVKALMLLPELFTVSHLLGNDKDEKHLYLIYAITIVFPFVFGIVLWHFAPALSERITSGLVKTKESTSLQTEALQVAIIATVGFLVIFLSIPSTLSLGMQLFETSTLIEGERVFNANSLAYFIGQVAKLLLGVVMVVGVKTWVRLINRFREFGLERKTSNKGV